MPTWRRDCRARRGSSEAFRELRDALGPERVVWRYSPILLGGCLRRREHHLRYFETFARTLRGVDARRCRLSFLDVYRKIAPRMEALGLVGRAGRGRRRALALRLAEIGAGLGIEVGGCGDAALDEAGLAGEGCIDAAHVEQRGGCRGRARGRGSRRQGACRCAPSVDVGTYDTCANGCVYCYANPGASGGAPWRLSRYDPEAPMLCDEVRPGDAVAERSLHLLPKAAERLF